MTNGYACILEICDHRYLQTGDTCRNILEEQLGVPGVIVQIDESLFSHQGKIKLRQNTMVEDFQKNKYGYFSMWTPAVARKKFHGNRPRS